MKVALSVLAATLGLGMIFSAVMSAVKTFIVPRPLVSKITRWTFVTVRRAFNLATKRVRTYEKRDSIFALYAPLSLIALPAVWLALVGLGYMLIFWAIDPGRSFGAAFADSGSSLFTLGFAPLKSTLAVAAGFSAALIGLALLALLISYLPTMYAAFQRRETMVSLLSVRAGDPPSALEMVQRFHLIGQFERLHELWSVWETWFAELDESHTSLPALAFFRSPQADRSWVTAAGAVLDAAALTLSTLDFGRVPEAALCLRAGYLALRHIADFFAIRYDAEPTRGDPISISEDEFYTAYEKLAALGVPLKADREAAYLDFAGWRVNYDTVLLELAALTFAPYATWSTDRAPGWHPPPLFRRR